MHCVSSSTFSILWNGNKLPHFKPTHGLRQGDPLSPYLFILCMEKLSVAINNAVSQRRWEPIRINNTEPFLSHLLFADDVLLFTKAKSSQFKVVSELFEEFSKVSGLRINLFKSRAFFSKGVPQAKIHKLTAISGIRSTTSLGKYLGFPILKGRPKRSDFSFIIEKMQNRLAFWKGKLLNKAGRLTLASSVLSSIPTYYMQINWLPQNICDNIDQVTHNFIWKGNNNKGTHLVNWKKIASPKQNGGLGIRAAREANTSLLGKLVWNLVQKTDKLWVNLLSNNYTSGLDFLFYDSARHNSSPTWSSIIRAKNVLRDGYVWRAGSGNTSFWYSNWSSLGTLGSQVPYVDIHDIHLSVHDVITNNGNHTHPIYTILPPNLADVINNIRLNFNPSIQDAFIWPQNKNGVYSTSSGFALLTSRHSAADHNSTSWRWIWRMKVPEKFKFLVWLACHEVVPTLALSNHRNMAASPTCSRCGDHDKTVLHCLRDCCYSMMIWKTLGFSSQQFFSSPVQLWLQEGASSSTSILFLSGLWWIWRHRNNMCLGNETLYVLHLCNNIHSLKESIRSAYNNAPADPQSARIIRLNNNNLQCTILNVDGSCSGNPIRTGYGGIIRNHSGSFISAFRGI